MGTNVAIRLESLIFSPLYTHFEWLRQGEKYSPFLTFNLRTNHLGFHLPRKPCESKKIPSQCRYPVSSSSSNHLTIFPMTIGKPLSPDRVFDFSIDEQEPHLAYAFFAREPLPDYVGNPNNTNGWIEAEVPLLGELGKMGEPLGAEAYKPMVHQVVIEFAEPIVEGEDQIGFEDDEEVWTVNEEWLIADASYVRTEHLRVIEDLGTHMGNLEYGHGQLVKKVMASQMVQAIGRLQQALVFEMSSRESTLMQCILRMDRRLVDLERRLLGPQ
nr:hypothetical protein [Tanacetum cinerariifolium]